MMPSYNTPSYNDLVEAIKQGSIKCVRRLLGESGATQQGYLSEVDSDGCTLLHHAVLNFKSKSDNIIKFLVEAEGSISILTVTNNIGCTPLQLAIRKHPLLPADTIKSLFRAYLYSSNVTPFQQYQLLERRQFKIFREQIPDLAEHLNIPDEHGFTALHYAVLYNAPATIVKTLIEWSEPDIDPMLSSTPKKPLPTIFPLHLAILAPLLERWNTPSEYNIKCLLSADNTVKKSLFSIFCQIDEKGEGLEYTPLHLAVFYKCTATVIADLVNADASGSKESRLAKKSVVMQNSNGQYPLQVALEKRLPKNVIETLLQADWSSNGETRFSVVSDFMNGTLPNEYVPLIIDEHILSHLRFPFEIPPKYFSNLAEKPMFQHYLNERWCITYAFAYLWFFDLYVYALGVICFMLQWEREEVYWAFILLGIISLLLIAREVLEMIYSGIVRWVKTPEHLLHLTYAILLIYCNFVTKLDATTEHTKNQRNTILVTGGLAWIMPILPLRTAVLSIALFVSGILNVSSWRLLTFSL
jgi:ankyrin repeat protein